MRAIDPLILASSMVIVGFLILLAWLAERRRNARIARWDERLRQGLPADAVPPAVRRTVLNVPAQAAGLTALMWLIAGLASFPQDGGLRLLLAIVGVGGTTSTLMVYFVIDLLWRPMIPVFFPKGDLSVAGGFRLPVLGRLLAAFLVVGLLSPAILVSLTWDRAPQVLAAPNPQALIANLRLLQLFILAAAGLASGLLAIATTQGITSRLQALQAAMRRVEEDDLTARVVVTSNDELGYLGERLNDMVEGLRERERLRKEQLRMERELEIAWTIQSSFLPTALPDVPGWHLAAELLPARVTSGDFYDIISLPSGLVGVLVADVADKGTGAALFMALCRTLIRTFAAEYADEPARTLQAANKRILQDTHSDLFVTVFYGVLNPSSGRLAYANAGHNPPFLLGAARPRPLVRTGIPLGIFSDQAWSQAEANVYPGEALLLYSDGVTEAQDLRRRLFGTDRMLATAQAQLGQSAPAMQTALLEAVRQFVGDAPQFDDITLLIAMRAHSD